MDPALWRALAWPGCAALGIGVFVTYAVVLDTGFSLSRWMGLLLFGLLAGGIVLAQRGVRRARGARARAWSRTLPFAVTGYAELARDGWKDVRAEVALGATPDEGTVELVTQLAHLLDDDVLVEAEGETVHLARIPASHGTAHGWAHGLLTEALVPLSTQIAVREVRLAVELRTSFSRPRRAAASRPAAPPAAPRRG